jgi:hypothetical protein
VTCGVWRVACDFRAGAWWEGGASIRRREINSAAAADDDGSKGEQDGKLVKLAQKLHMNTG